MNASLIQRTSVRDEALAILSRLGTPESAFEREGLMVSSPITGEFITHVRVTGPKEANAVIGRAAQAFDTWRTIPAPRRGEFVRILAEELRAAKDDLGRLVTLETGKIVSEGLGEVQEMIDICDFAVGLSRQLYGRTIATERAAHRMMESLASARSLWRHLRVQFSGRGMVLECGARGRLRRPGSLEALREDATHGTRHAGRGQPCAASIW